MIDVHGAENLFQPFSSDARICVSTSKNVMLSAIAATLNRATYTLGFNTILNWIDLDAGKSSAGGRGTTSQQP